MAKKNDLKLKDNKILWWNGAKWLTKETCFERGATAQNIALAKKRIKELENV
jgi:hypothetical protein